MTRTLRTRIAAAALALAASFGVAGAVATPVSAAETASYETSPQQDTNSSPKSQPSGGGGTPQASSYRWG